ncbi:MAG: glycosyltransferase family 2 protein [Microcoleaceae cyanobacterium]
MAHNEAALIGQMLSSLLQQSVFQAPSCQDDFSQSNDSLHNTLTIEIIIVPNGCTDKTAEISRSILQQSINSTTSPNIDWKVYEIEEPGKSNAWNAYVHSLSARDAQYLFLIDSDIQILDPQTLHSMMETLETRSEAWVAMDQPIKDVRLKEKKNLMDRLSVAASALSGSAPKPGEAAWICGQLYCARAEILRQIYLPTALPTQDFFLSNMITTAGLTSPREPNRVILSDSASHVFESYTTIGRLLRHEKWLITGIVLNELIYRELQPQVTHFKDAGLIIKQYNEQNPQWLNQLVETTTKQSLWLIPQYILTRRFRSLQRKSWLKAISFFPLVILAFIIDLLVSIQANLALHQGRALGYWRQSAQ